ncbi:MAG: sel1 repeat family protein [Bauldia sp.]|nr:sel1 repeat family protein [Bauldia sp.]
MAASVQNGLAQSAERPIQLAQSDAGGSYLDLLVERAKGLLDEQSGNRNPSQAAVILEEAVRAGSVSAMHLLADLYATGDGVEASFDRARQLLEDAIAAGDETFGSRDLGNLYRDAESPNRSATKAAAAYERAAELGDSVSMIALAQLLAADSGGLDPDYARARDLLQRAVIAGEVIEGSRELGTLLRSAPTPVYDPAGAVSAYQRAVDLGDVSSMFSLAEMLAAGDGVPVDFERARDLLVAAIAAGQEVEGSAALGNLYLEAAPPNRDPAAAVKAFEQAIALGDTTSMIELAQILAAGTEVPMDFDRARRLVEAAIAAGSARTGWRTLGDIYRDAGPDDRDLAMAAEAYQKAVDLGDNASRISLGKILAADDSVPGNFDRARVLFEAAVANGDIRGGSRALGDLYRTAEAQNRRPAMAVAAYVRAAELGDPWAMIPLARMLAAGDGVPADFDAARAWLEKVVEAGEPSVGYTVLGSLFLRADEPNRDAAKAAEYFQKAVDIGNTDAMIELANLYAAGDGVPADFDRAKTLLDAAIAGGDVGAGSVALGDLYLNAAPPRRDVALAKQAYETAIGVGDTGAMRALANMYATGDGVPVDFDKALALLQEAIAAGDVRQGSRALGDLYRDAAADHRDPLKAVAAYQAAILLGDAPSMISLAKMLGDGDGVAINFDAARQLLEDAIQAGSIGPASRALGDLYRTADADHRDPAKAEESYQRAIETGDAWAMMMLGRMLAKGDGLAFDFDRARSLYEDAVKAGQPGFASRFLGDLYLDAPAPQRDPVNALAAYKAAADLGNAGAMLALANLYSSGDTGVAKDFDLARDMLESAVAAGEVAAGSRALGDLYSDESTPNRDLGKAREAYERAAELGETSAMTALANMYQNGRGVPIDLDKARVYLEQAVAAGDVSTAAFDLGQLYLRLPDDQRDPLQAAEAFEAAAKAGNTSADLTLGVLLLEEIRDPRNYESAGEHLRTAAAALGAGNVAAQLMRMPPQALISIVQQYLRGGGYGGSVDGVHGRGTEAAIKSYCETKAIANCDGTFISFDLLVSLLSAPS